MDTLSNYLVRYGIQVSPVESGQWCAFVYDNIFADDGSEAYQLGATPMDAVEKTVQYYLMFSGVTLL